MADPVLKARAAALFRKLGEQDRRDALGQVIGGPAGLVAATQILPIQ